MIMRRAVAIAALSSMALSACMSAPRTIASPRTYIPLRRPERVWITDKDGTVLEVARPRVLPGDTLFARSSLGEEVWLPLSEIQRVQARELDKTKTMLVIGGTIAALGLVIAIASGTGSGLDKDIIDRPEMNFILFRSK